MNRKGFLRTILGSAATLFLGPLVAQATPSRKFAVSDVVCEVGGTIPMCVDSVQGNDICCQWFEETSRFQWHLHKRSFRHQDLELIATSDATVAELREAIEGRRKSIDTQRLFRQNIAMT